jgi:secernin
MDLVRLGLERGRTAAGAVDVVTSLLEKHGQGGSGIADTFDPYDSSFLVADHREGWIVETCGRTWAARPVGAGAAISNRITLGDDWTRASADLSPGTSFQEYRHPRVPTALADHRLAATRRCVAEGAGTAGPAELVATLRDHGTGPWGRPGAGDDAVAPPTEVGDDLEGVTVCMHVRGVQATTASMICSVGEDPRDIRVWVALGAPCVSVFVPLRPATGVPVELSDPTAWWAGAARRDAVDADPHRLGAVRAELDPLEARLWERPVGSGFA